MPTRGTSSGEQGSRFSGLPTRDRSAQIEMFYRALTTELGYYEANGKLLASEKVFSFMRKTGSQLKNLLMQIPSRMSKRLASETNEEISYQLLVREVERITQEIERLVGEDHISESLAKEEREKGIIKKGTKVSGF